MFFSNVSIALCCGDRGMPQELLNYRPSTGEWFVLTSETFGVYAFPFGASGDVPAPGDYDGDGKTDAAVFRPANGTWFIPGSTSGISVAFWGSAEDKPVPAVFIP